MPLRSFASRSESRRRYSSIMRGMRASTRSTSAPIARQRAAMSFQMNAPSASRAATSCLMRPLHRFAHGGGQLGRESPRPASCGSPREARPGPRAALCPSRSSSARRGRTRSRRCRARSPDRRSRRPAVTAAVTVPRDIASRSIFSNSGSSAWRRSGSRSVTRRLRLLTERTSARTANRPVSARTEAESRHASDHVRLLGVSGCRVSRVIRRRKSSLILDRDLTRIRGANRNPTAVPNGQV